MEQCRSEEAEEAKQSNSDMSYAEQEREFVAEREWAGEKQCGMSWPPSRTSPFAQQEAGPDKH